VLTGGSVANHAGVRRWLGAADGRVLETIQAALCLDELLPLAAAGMPWVLLDSAILKRNAFLFLCVSGLNR
jgi:hypothetical protein